MAADHVGNGDTWQDALRSGPAALPRIERHITSAIDRGDLPLAAQLSAEAALLAARIGDRTLADHYIAQAFTLSNDSGDLTIRGIVAWRYVGMLLVFDNIGTATKLAEQLRATLEPDTDLPLRLVGLSVAIDVAATAEDWRNVRRLAGGLLAAAAGSNDAQALVAQADLADALASSRLGDPVRAEDAARRCWAAATEGAPIDALAAGALAVLATTASDPPVDAIPTLLEIAARYRAKDDVANAAAALVTAGEVSRMAGMIGRAGELFEEAIRATNHGPHLFLNAKARIWNARLAGPAAHASELHEAWSRLRAIIVDVAHPERHRDLTIGWAGLADQLLRCASDIGTGSLEDVLVDIFAVLGADAAASVLVGNDERSGDSATADHLLENVEALWQPRVFSRAPLIERLAGAALIAYRVVVATEASIAGWRLSIAVDGSVDLAEINVQHDAALELKLLAERDPRAPSSGQRTWNDLAEALLPTWPWPPERLIVIPHGPLWLVPFNGLEVNGAPLVATTTVSLATSMNMPAGVPVRPTEAVAVIDRALPHVDIELEALGAAGTVSTATAVDEVAPLLLSQSVDVLFIAAHGTGHGADFAVSLDRNASIADFSTWKFPPLVVAPSCFSARQSFESWPPSLVSIALLSGATWFVGGLWAVPSAPTAAITRNFISQLAAGQTPPQALRLAVLDVRRDHPDVSSWAGIVVFGWPTDD